jgi:hypothetical protein
MKRRWIWVVLGVVILALVLPMPIAERYSSPTQDGQYLLHPMHSYEFVLTVLKASGSSKFRTSGQALVRAKSVFAQSRLMPSAVHLLFFADPESYSYTAKGGQVLTLERPPSFVWEVWGTLTVNGSPQGQRDVIALLDYDTGELLARVPEPAQ